MNRKKGNPKKSNRSFTMRLMAVVLAFTLAFTSSGITSLAEAVDEGSTETAAVTIEEQAAEQAAAEAAAAEQAAAEQAAAEQAAAEQAAAEQAAAEQAAAEQAAAEAAAAEAAAAEQTEAESVTTEAAAAEQTEVEPTAAEAETTEQTTEEAEESESTEAASDENETEAETEEEPEASEEPSEEEEAETEEATEAETEPAESHYEADADGIVVKVDAPAGALPEDAELHALRYDKDSAEYKAIENALNDKNENEAAANLEALNIYFTADDEAVNPAESVTVRIGMSDFLAENEAADLETLEAWKFAEGEEDTLTAALAADTGSKSDGSVDVENVQTKFTTDSLGKVGMTWENKEEEEATEAEEKVYTAGDGGVLVTVTAPADAFPADAQLRVVLYSENSEEYEEAADVIGFEGITDEDGIALLSAEEGSWEFSTGLAVVDIAFYADGEKVEPSKPVSVVIDASELIPESADESSIEVQHLIEGEDGEVTPVVVASETEVAEFEVESFSTFTIEWNDGTGTSITVHVYNINGTSIDEELDEFGYSGTDGVILIDELVSHLEQNASYTSTYTFAYATIYYETTNNQGGFDPGTVGDEDNSVTQISKSGTDYTVIYGGSTTTVSDPYVVTIHLYYSLPMVTLTATENTDGTVGFTTESSYFTGDTDEAEYHWALSDDSYGSITPGEDGTATFTWSEDAVTGDQVSVTVTMTVGDETASDTYTLTYGTESETITVTLNGTAQANANVALVDENGTTVATGKTGDDGTITLDVVPGTYTVGVTYVTYDSTGGGSTTRYTNSGTVTVNEDGTITGDTTVNLTTAVTSGPGGDTDGSASGTWSTADEYYYEHIDVKIAVAEGADADAVFSDLDRVYVYDEYGNLIYYSLDLVENDDTTDYNTLFDVNGTEGHSLVVSSSDTIILVFEVYENGEYRTYTETITPSATYPEGEYYSYSDVNAYQLYNSIYGTNISENDWETALNNGTLQTLLGDNYNANGIAIGGMSFIQVADYLCDTRDTDGQAGLDFVIDVGLISVLYETYDLQIAKSLEGVPDYVTSVEKFEFTLQELSMVSDTGGYTEAIWNTANTIGNASATTGDWTKEADGTWSAIADFGDFLGYEAEEGTTLFYYVLSEKDSDSATAEVQYYGIKVSVEYSSATGIATVTASYCELVKTTDEEGVYNRNSGWTGLTAYTGEDENGSEYTYFSIPFVNTYTEIIGGFELDKTDEDGNELSGAEFILGYFGEYEESFYNVTGDNQYEYYYGILNYDEESGTYVFDWNQYSETREDATTLTTGEDGKISITNLPFSDEYEAGFFLIETNAPNGYELIEDPIVFTVSEDGTVQIAVDNDHASMNENGTVMTVTDALAVIDIPVTKNWDDNDDEYGFRPSEIQVQLIANDTEVEDKVLTLSEGNHWSGAFENLPKFDEDGNLIEYTVEEPELSGLGRYYVPEVEGDMYTGITVNNTLNINFYPLDEEIVTDPVGDMFNENDTYVKNESVNEWNEIEIEISTTLPDISSQDMEYEGFTYTMLFHDQLSLELNLDETESDFSVWINEVKIDPKYYTVTFGVIHDEDNTCDFEVEVDLSALYQDGIITEDDMGTAPIQIFFWADLEDADFGDTEDTHYTSTTWYEVYQEYENEDGETQRERLYTSNVDVVYVYTYEINLLKYDASAVVDGDYESAALEGATFGIYYDETCTDAIQRYDVPAEHKNGENDSDTNYDYTAASDEDGNVIFYGLQAGTFYVKELEAPEGYLLSDRVVEVELNDEVGENVHNGYFADAPEPTKGVDTDNDGVFEDNGTGVQVGDTLTYEITYFNGYDQESTVTITDPLDPEKLEYVDGSASDNGEYDPETNTLTWTLTADALTGGSVTFQVVVLEGAQETNEIENTAYVQVNDNSLVTNTVYNPVPHKDVDIHENGSYGDSGRKVVVGDTLTYKIDYNNPDDEKATVVITDELDEGLDFVKAYEGGDYDGSTRTITWTIENVPAHTSGSVTFEAKVNENAQTEVENTATVKVGDHPAQETNKVENPVEPDAEPEQSESETEQTESETEQTESETRQSESEPQPTEPKKYVDIDSDGEFNDNKKEVSVGDELTYKITYYNNHTYADTVTITDTLDDNLEYVQGSASDNGFYDEETKTVTWYIGAKARENGEVTFKVKVLDEAGKAGEVLNKATVQIGSDTPQETNELENPVKETSESGSGSNPTGGTTTPTSRTTPTSGTSGTSGTSSTASSVKTADETPVGPMAVLMLAALAMMLGALTYRKRRAER